MGYYMSGGTPPQEPRWWHRFGQYVPQRVKNCWADLAETCAMIRVTFSVLMPLFAMLLAFVLACAGALFLVNVFAGP